jgi:GT2 family glycosyltransferase
MILNDDVVVQKDPFDIEKFIDENPADFYTGMGYYSFIIPIATYDKIGGFDELYYPAYYEDTDYTYRLQVAGMRKLDTEFLLPEILRTSKSGEKDRSLYDKVFECRRHYENKWGGAPTQEKYTKPFNQ